MSLWLILLSSLCCLVSAQWPQLCKTSGPTSAWNETRCPATQSCSPNGFSVSGQGCCPWPGGVSCGDYACCPAGSTCVATGGSGYGSLFNCSGAGVPAGTTARCPCKPGPPLPPSQTLKNVLILGDSLTIGLTPYVARALSDVALVQHAPWDVSDGGAEEVAYMVQCMDNWLHSPSGLPLHVDVIWFNSGMHNLLVPGPGVTPVPGQSDFYTNYPAGLATATAALKAYASATGTKLVYGLTTAFLCSAATDAIITADLNSNATAIMAAAGIPVVDQHTPIIEKCGAAPTPSCFGLKGCFCPHCPPGYSWLASTVIAPAIRAML